MLSVFKALLDSTRLFNFQRLQYSEKIYLEDTVPQESTKQANLAITTLGDFYCKFITGSFSTLVNDGGDIKDDGVVHLRGKLVDGSNQRQLFNNYIPLNLFLSPGRTKSSASITVLTDAPGNSLFYPIELDYFFAKSNDILFDVKNDSNTPNYYGLVFHGIRRLPIDYLKKGKGKK